jgi:hypothetical protein
MGKMRQRGQFWAGETFSLEVMSVHIYAQLRGSWATTGFDCQVRPFGAFAVNLFLD